MICLVGGALFLFIGTTLLLQNGHVSMQGSHMPDNFFHASFMQVFPATRHRY